VVGPAFTETLSQVKKLWAIHPFLQICGCARLPKPCGRLKTGEKVESKNKMSENELDIVEITELFQLLPHRYPFLLIDKIIDVNGDKSAIGIKNITVNEPHFNGHFPGKPIMPGVLIIEAMAQTAGAICAREHSKGAVKLVYFMSIDRVKFRKPVIPGDVLKLHVTQTKHRRGIFKYDCVAEVDGAKVAEGLITAMMIDPGDT
jgi:3-hydroxyacyl-[acyl-carrier-protein] dehydratase